MKNYIIALLLFTYTINSYTNSSHTCTINIPLKKHDYIYHDTINISVDHPAIELKQWNTSLEPEKIYDTLFKENRLVLLKSFTISVQISIKSYPFNDAHIYIRYYQKSKKKFVEQFIPITVKPTESHTTIISIEKKKQQYTLARKKNNFNFPTWWQDLHAIINYLKTEYQELLFIWWLLIALILCFTPLACPTLLLTSHIILQKKIINNMYYKLLFVIFYALFLYGCFEHITNIAPHIAKYVTLYMHTFYSCALIIFIAYTLQWHTHIINYIQKNKFFWLYKTSSIAILCAYLQALCVYPIPYLITSHQNIYFVQLLFLITINIPLFIVIIRYETSHLLTYIHDWAQESCIGFGYLCMYATIGIWYYTEHISSATSMYLTACTSLIIGVWYFVHAKNIQPLWSYISKIVGIILCASTLTCLFYGYKLSYIT